MQKDRKFPLTKEVREAGVLLGKHKGPGVLFKQSEISPLLPYTHLCRLRVPITESS